MFIWAFEHNYVHLSLNKLNEPSINQLQGYTHAQSSLTIMQHGSLLCQRTSRDKSIAERCCNMLVITLVSLGFALMTQGRWAQENGTFFLILVLISPWCALWVFLCSFLYLSNSFYLIHDHVKCVTILVKHSASVIGLKWPLENYFGGFKPMKLKLYDTTDIASPNNHHNIQRSPLF